MNGTQTVARELAPVREPLALRLRGRLLVVLAAVAAFVFGGAGSAFATSTDPTGGVFVTGKSDLTSLIIPAAAGLVVVGIVFAVAVRWMSKGMKKG